jgi:uncharacterized repeat protein (TIGR01451 family)
VAANDAYALLVNNALNVTAPGLLANDTDANGDVLTAAVVASPAVGTLDLQPNGAFTYLPPPGFTGVLTFTYHAGDGLEMSNAAVVTVTIAGTADLGIVQSASASQLAPGQWLTYTLVFSNAGPTLAVGVVLTDRVPPQLSSVSFSSSGAVLTPTGNHVYAWLVADLAPGAGGVVTVTGRLAPSPRGLVFSNTAQIAGAYADPHTANNASSRNVSVANTPPVAAEDVYTLTYGSLLSVTAPGVLSGDADANGDSLSAILIAGPPVGTLHLQPDGSFDYTPPPDFVGTVSFTYEASDGLAVSKITTVTITITGHRLFLPLALR